MLSVLLLVLQFKPVQTWMAKKTAAYLSKELKTTIGIKSLDIRPFTSVRLEGLYIIDRQHDTLLNTPLLSVAINKFSVFNSIKQRKLNFNDIQLDNGSFYLKKLKDSTTNLDFIIDYFNSPDTVKRPSRPWTLIFGRLAVNNLHFRYKNYLRDTIISNRINFNDIDVRAFTAEVFGMDIKNHIFQGDVRHLSFKEKSGFTLKSFTAQATIDTNQILLKKLSIVTPQTHLKDYFRMRFKKFSDMDEDFEDRVMMDADFKSSQIASKDIAYFTSGLEKTSFDLGIDGKVKGLVKNLKATGLTITGGQATYISGDFNLKGLPDWDNTFLELKINQVASNRRDLEYLYNRFVGATNRKLPDVLDKFGNFNFKGRFTGFQNDFVAYGEFKTALGRFESDVNLKISKAGTPAYSGNIKAYDFALGKLIDESDIGRTTFVADVKGCGDELKNMAEQIDARLTYFDYKGYRYNNILTKGSIQKKVFAGHVTIDDRYLKLDLKGSADLNPAKPVYDLNASIGDAHLHNLHFLKDTIIISAQLNTHFAVKSLSDIEGNILVSSMRIVDPRNNIVVDSVQLTASGKGRDRLISLQSPMADGSIKGNFDVATLPSYFKTIVKKYIPSIKTDITPFKSQDFDFNLKIKDITPLAVIFVPSLRIPEPGTFVGQFSSATDQASLSGYIKTIEYGGMTFHDLILDENTSDTFLGLNLSLSKIDLSKSLYIKNINIANTLKKDSLNFNIKLSDKDATNQLDLYGLVEFGRDTTAKLKLLPSDVILEHQPWKIQEQVRIRLLDGKTQVSGFEMSNGLQKVRINGFISDNPADKLKVDFDHFSMSTFNQLAKASDIKLLGTMNGNVTLSEITKSPAFEANLGIDSLTMNQTLVGDVKILSKLDNGRKQADVKLNIMNRGLETMNIAGIYDLTEGTKNAFNFDVKMDQTEAIIFSPFIKDLVTDVKGTVSTDLRLTGPTSNPQLNGKVTLSNTGVKVNYLQAAYTLNDQLTVDNSVVKIKDLKLRDARGGEGVANGTVNLNNIANPDLDVSVKATNLMALNTTFKDNHLYYGTAYATGNFYFSGPTDNMNIDIDASTNDGTVFNLPLNTSSTASEYDFIHYASHKDTTEQRIETVNAFKGVTLNMNLKVDEKSLVKISTDYGRLEGRGIANDLQLKINSLGDFEMFGDYLIQSGKFEFTAKDFISKNFTVNQGGTIRWTGNPNNAGINLRATYEVRTGISNLYSAAGQQSPYGDQQKLVQAELILTNTLLQPTINFDFTFPTDPSIKDDLATYLNDENNRNQQALSLIIRRQFAPGTGSNLSNEVAQTAEQAVSEFAFNKLNTFISQSNIKNVDINIRSASDASATLHFWNDRIVLNGNLYSSNGTNNLFSSSSSSFFNADASTFVKDFEADFLIRKDGRLRLRYSYRVLNTTTLSSLIGTSQILYVNGLGLIYQRDFDTFGEFVRAIFSRGHKRPTNGNTPPATTAPPPLPYQGNSKKEEEE